MKHVILKIVVLFLFFVSAVATLGLMLYVQYDHFMFKIERGEVLVMIGNSNLAFILLGIMVIQFVGVMMMIVDMTADAEAKQQSLDGDLLE